MDADEQAKLDRDRATLRRKELEVKPRDPLPGQASFLPRTGWNLATSRPLTPEQRERADAMAAAEAETKGNKKPSRKKGGDGG